MQREKPRGWECKRTGTIRYRQCVRVNAEEQRSIDAPLLAILANRLTNGEDMLFVERPFERGTTMPRGAKRDPLLRHRRVRRLGIEGRHELGYVDQHRGLRGLPRERTYCHCSIFHQSRLLLNDVPPKTGPSGRLGWRSSGGMSRGRGRILRVDQKMGGDQIRAFSHSRWTCFWGSDHPRRTLIILGSNHVGRSHARSPIRSERSAIEIR